MLFFNVKISYKCCIEKLANPHDFQYGLKMCQRVVRDIPFDIPIRIHSILVNYKFLNNLIVNARDFLKLHAAQFSRDAINIKHNPATWNSYIWLLTYHFSGGTEPD